MNRFVLKGAGAPWDHNLDYTVDRPGGFGYYSFCYFQTPCIIKTKAGLEHYGPGSIVLFTPDFPQWYRGDGVGFINDWLDFSGKDVLSFIDSLHLPLNEEFRINDPSFIGHLIRDILRESYRRSGFWDVAVNIGIEDFLLHVARGLLETQERSLEPLKLRQYELLRHIRQEILEKLSHPWLVDTMASMMNISSSRFTVLYREAFGVSPKEDLLAARIERAKQLLKNTGASVTFVAEQIGISETQYFSRLFKNKVGWSPSEYHRQFSDL